LLASRGRGGEPFGEGRDEILVELAKLRVAIGEVRAELTGLYAKRQALLVAAYNQRLNMSEVARTLGVTREALYRVLRKELVRFER
jgi:transcriptional regulator of acetoin/glycerol metabolism